ncbi:aldolase/citrate lyase family protein [Nocardia sp. NBC_01730]|uniref:HpcH/HpaI aldolase family protein n=1 Tax=Nocardia sp. NBC_01730 TaxID=2975998 RepID=UPI002E0D877F|nr:aldolase/citrate lyase family protein [Nocardia sp. NBC_01730]
MTMRVNAVKRKITAGEPVHGLFCSIPAPALVEMIGYGGYDFVVLDTEHTQLDPQQLENLIRAAETTALTPLVRVPSNDPGAILRALDAGALGIVVPHVCSRADIDTAIKAAYYTPIGMRSLGSGRTTRFGSADPVQHLAAANAEIMMVPLLEDADGVEAIDDILTGGNIDLVLPGPGDLSQSYGVPWQLRHPLVLSAVDRLHNACSNHDVPFGAIVRTTERYAHWHEAGVRAFVHGDAADMAAAALRNNLAVLRS